MDYKELEVHVPTSKTHNGNKRYISLEPMTFNIKTTSVDAKSVASIFQVSDYFSHHNNIYTFNNELYEYAYHSGDSPPSNAIYDIMMRFNHSRRYSMVDSIDLPFKIHNMLSDIIKGRDFKTISTTGISHKDIANLSQQNLKNLEDKLLFNEKDKAYYLKIDTPIISYFKRDNTTFSFKLHPSHHHMSYYNTSLVFNLNQSDQANYYINNILHGHENNPNIQVKDGMLINIVPEFAHLLNVDTTLINNLNLIKAFKNSFLNIKSFQESPTEHGLLYYDAKKILTDFYQHNIRFEDNTIADFVERMKAIQPSLPPHLSEYLSNYDNLQQYLSDNDNINQLKI